MSVSFVGPSTIALDGRPVDWGLRLDRIGSAVPKVFVELFEDFLESGNIRLCEFYVSFVWGWYTYEVFQNSSRPHHSSSPKRQVSRY